MPAPDLRAPFAALGGVLPPELAALPTPCYLLDEGQLARNAELLGALAARTGCKVLLAQKAFSNYDLYPLLAPHLAGTEASGLFEARLGENEVLLLCSDGLTGMAEDEKIADTLKNAKTLALAGDALLTLALEGGGRDNITVALFTRGAEEEA